MIDERIRLSLRPALSLRAGGPAAGTDPRAEVVKYVVEGRRSGPEIDIVKSDRGWLIVGDTEPRPHAFASPQGALAVLQFELDAGEDEGSSEFLGGQADPAPPPVEEPSHDPPPLPRRDPPAPDKPEKKTGA
jgi:hypothetical protein